jgi:hypothetical protein
MRDHRAVWLVLMLVAPAVAFVFVPMRGAPTGVTAIAEHHGPAPAVAADAEGDLFVAHRDRLTAEIGDGIELWSVPFTPPRACAGVVAADGLAIAFVEEGTEALHFSLEAYSADKGTPRWRLPGLLRGAPLWLHVPRRRDASNTTYGVLTAVAGGQLTVIDLKSGQVVGSRPLEAVESEPLWVEDSGFAVSADSQGPLVVGFDAVRPGDAAQPWPWSWRPPAGESVKRLEWLRDGGGLVIYGREQVYLGR